MNLNQAHRELKKLRATQPDNTLPTLEQWRKYHHLPIEEYYEKIGITPSPEWLEYQKRTRAHIKQMLEDFADYEESQ